MLFGVFAGTSSEKIACRGKWKVYKSENKPANHDTLGQLHFEVVNSDEPSRLGWMYALWNLCTMSLLLGLVA